MAFVLAWAFIVVLGFGLQIIAVTIITSWLVATGTWIATSLVTIALHWVTIQGMGYFVAVGFIEVLMDFGIVELELKLVIKCDPFV